MLPEPREKYHPAPSALRSVPPLPSLQKSRLPPPEPGGGSPQNRPHQFRDLPASCRFSAVHPSLLPQKFLGSSHLGFTEVFFRGSRSTARACVDVAAPDLPLRVNSVNCSNSFCVSVLLYRLSHAPSKRVAWRDTSCRLRSHRGTTQCAAIHSANSPFISFRYRGTAMAESSFASYSRATQPW